MVVERADPSCHCHFIISLQCSATHKMGHLYLLLCGYLYYIYLRSTCSLIEKHILKHFHVLLGVQHHRKGQIMPIITFLTVVSVNLTTCINSRCCPHQSVLVRESNHCWSCDGERVDACDLIENDATRNHHSQRWSWWPWDRSSPLCSP